MTKIPRFFLRGRRRVDRWRRVLSGTALRNNTRWQVCQLQTKRDEPQMALLSLSGGTNKTATRPRTEHQTAAVWWEILRVGGGNRGGGGGGARGRNMLGVFFLRTTYFLENTLIGGYSSWNSSKKQNRLDIFPQLLLITNCCSLSWWGSIIRGSISLFLSFHEVFYTEAHCCHPRKKKKKTGLAITLQRHSFTNNAKLIRKWNNSHEHDSFTKQHVSFTF